VLVLDMVTTLASVVSLCIVAYTAWIAKASLESAKKDSKMRSRPMMYARFAETPLAGMGRYDLVIGNAGPSVARNVSVTFDPPGLVLSDSNKEPKAANHIIKRYKDPIPNWVPEEVAHNVYFVGDDQPRRENKEPLPDKLTVYLQYENDEKQTFKDVFRLDVHSLAEETRVTRKKNGGILSPAERIADAVEHVARKTI